MLLAPEWLRWNVKTNFVSYTLLKCYRGQREGKIRSTFALRSTGSEPIIISVLYRLDTWHRYITAPARLASLIKPCLSTAGSVHIGLHLNFKLLHRRFSIELIHFIHKTTTYSVYISLFISFCSLCYVAGSVCVCSIVVMSFIIDCRLYASPGYRSRMISTRNYPELL